MGCGTCHPFLVLQLGRNMAEIKRVLIALQAADKYKCAIPLNWQQGEKVIVPPPKTLNELEERLESNYEMVDFYLAKKDLKPEKSEVLN